MCPPAIPERFPGPSMEAPAHPKLDRGGQSPLEQLIQGEAQQVGLEEGLTAGHHGQHHGQHEHRQGEGTAVPQQPSPVLQLSSAVIGSQRPAVRPVYNRKGYEQDINMYVVL